MYIFALGVHSCVFCCRTVLPTTVGSPFKDGLTEFTGLPTTVGPPFKDGLTEFTGLPTTVGSPFKDGLTEFTGFPTTVGSPFKDGLTEFTGFPTTDGSLFKVVCCRTGTKCFGVQVVCLQGPSLLHMMQTVLLSLFSSVENVLFKMDGVLSFSPFNDGYSDWTGLPTMVDKAIMFQMDI